MLYDRANNVGQLWDFGDANNKKEIAKKIIYPTTQNSGSREPDVVTGASSGSDSASGTSNDGASSNLQEAGLSSTATASDFKVQLQNEFDDMVESVRIYGGFYIGRYETGNLSQETPVVQKNNTDIGGVTWYRAYRINKNVKVNDNVVSSMIWGCQWDATLRWMQNYGTTEAIRKFATDSKEYGNYTGTTVGTGSDTKYAVNNIFDMGGNKLEWTLEADQATARMLRGNAYGSENMASARDNLIPTGSGGSRTVLHISL